MLEICVPCHAVHVFTLCEGPRHAVASHGIAALKITLMPNTVDIDAFGVGAAPDAVLRASLDLGGCRVAVLTACFPHAEAQRHHDLLDAQTYPWHSMWPTKLVTLLKPLQTVAQGRLPVASDVVGPRGLIPPNENGLLFEAGTAAMLGDTMAQSLSDRVNWPVLPQCRLLFGRVRTYLARQRWRPCSDVQKIIRTGSICLHLEPGRASSLSDRAAVVAASQSAPSNISPANGTPKRQLTVAGSVTAALAGMRTTCYGPAWNAWCRPPVASRAGCVTS